MSSLFHHPEKFCAYQGPRCWAKTVALSDTTDRNMFVTVNCLRPTESSLDMVLSLLKGLEEDSADHLWNTETHQSQNRNCMGDSILAAACVVHTRSARPALLA